MSDNSNLSRARKVKDDEYYTRYEDVENELKHYKDYLKDKVIYCPCDDVNSAFVKYLKYNQNEIGYKKVVYTSFKDGFDFREQDNSFADVIISNPPFSLFREFMDWVGDKECIVLGPNNAPVYKNIFPKIKDGKLKLGTLYNKPMTFDRPDGSEKRVSIGWYTTFSVRKVEPLKLKTKAENEANGVVYKKFDNYDAINVDRTKDIPSDYNGLMGVPITFLDKWISEDYEIENTLADPEETKVDGKSKYAKIVIKKNFEIVCSTQRGCHDKSLELKTYEDYKEVRPDGTETGCSGKKLNGNPVVEYYDKNRNYFVNKDGDKVQSLYERIIIKKIS